METTTTTTTTPESSAYVAFLLWEHGRMNWTELDEVLASTGLDRETLGRLSREAHAAFTNNR
jgi:hypothetical protein